MCSTVATSSHDFGALIRRALTPRRCVAVGGFVAKSALVGGEVVGAQARRSLEFRRVQRAPQCECRACLTPWSDSKVTWRSTAVDAEVTVVARTTRAAVFPHVLGSRSVAIGTNLSIFQPACLALDFLCVLTDSCAELAQMETCFASKCCASVGVRPHLVFVLTVVACTTVKKARHAEV